MTPRIPPKNGATFTPGSVIRLEFPAQGYVNPNNTTLSFDVTLTYGQILSTDKTSTVRFQNNVIILTRFSPASLVLDCFMVLLQLKILLATTKLLDLLLNGLQHQPKAQCVKLRSMKVLVVT